MPFEHRRFEQLHRLAMRRYKTFFMYEPMYTYGGIQYVLVTTLRANQMP
jgi:hypothetical protein